MKTWNVSLDGVTHPEGFAANSEAEAVAMWARRTGRLTATLREKAPKAKGGVRSWLRRLRRREEWYVLKLRRDKTAFIGGGPWDHPDGAVDFARLNVTGPWLMFRAPPGTLEAFEEARSSRSDARGDWYILEIHRFKHGEGEAFDIGEGPWETAAEAREHARDDVVWEREPYGYEDDEEDPRQAEWALFRAPTGTMAAFAEARKGKR